MSLLFTISTGRSLLPPVGRRKAWPGERSLAGSSFAGGGVVGGLVVLLTGVRKPPSSRGVWEVSSSSSDSDSSSS